MAFLIVLVYQQYDVLKKLSDKRRLILVYMNLASFCFKEILSTEIKLAKLGRESKLTETSTVTPPLSQTRPLKGLHS